MKTTFRTLFAAAVAMILSGTATVQAGPAATGPDAAEQAVQPGPAGGPGGRSGCWTVTGKTSPRGTSRTT